MAKRKKQYRLEDLDCLLCFAMDMAGPNGELPPIEEAEPAFREAIREARLLEENEKWKDLATEKAKSQGS